MDDGMKQLQDSLNELFKQFDDIKNIDLEKVGLAGAYTLMAESQKLAPVDTSFLQNSPFVEADPGKGGILTYGAEYAFYQEFGWSNYEGANNGRGYIRLAIDEQGSLIVENMKKALQEDIDDKVK